MALIKCPECGQLVSDKAEICPKCGKRLVEVSSPKKKSNFGIVVLIAIIVFVVVIVNLGTNDKKSYQKQKTNSYQSYYGSNSGKFYETPLSGNEKALAQAESYLKSMPFSYNGLLEQLVFHGFSESEAKYAVDHCNADWKFQAVRQAKSYISSQAFSSRGLLEQLEYEGFSKEEAKYGVENCGANWNAEAVEKANSYLKSFPDWGKYKLIDQLEFEGFTSNEAEYGVEHSNLNY